MRSFPGHREVDGDLCKNHFYILRSVFTVTVDLDSISHRKLDAQERKEDISQSSL